MYKIAKSTQDIYSPKEKHRMKEVDLWQNQQKIVRRKIATNAQIRLWLNNQQSHTKTNRDIGITMSLFVICRNLLNDLIRQIFTDFLILK